MTGLATRPHSGPHTRMITRMRGNDSGSVFLEVAPGCIATVETSLEMTAPRASPLQPPAQAADYAVERRERMDLAEFRGLYDLIGAEWLWFSRNRLSDEALAAILHDPAVEVWVLSDERGPAGLLELDARTPDAVEIAFFGVAARLEGTGAAARLMALALERAWARPGVRRLWLHTCTLDHPKALAFYRRAGFRAYARAIEVSPDPRLDGSLPTTVADHHPIIPPETP